MRVNVVAGYGDATKYLEWLTASWPERYGLEPHIRAFGTTDGPETYDQHWQAFVDWLEPGPAIGVSFGGAIVERASIELPNMVPRIIVVSGPHNLEDMDPRVMDTNYPMLRPALAAFDPKDLRPESIATFRSRVDRVIEPWKVVIDGAQNNQVRMVGHTAGIVAAFLFSSHKMAQFLREN